jgi:AcrR family transcriptional regulator
MSSERSGLRSGSVNAPAELLTLRTSPPKERADAARNRAVVLDAAAELFRTHGVGAVSLDAIAAAAGVGKGTLFRRFGDKAGLAVALLDEQERVLQDAILFGPAPLGPGQPAATPPRSERLHAFVDAYLDHVLANLDLVRMSETAAPGARYRIGAYRFWHRHVTLLLDGEDAAADAHALLATLAAEHVAAVAAELEPVRIRGATHRVAAALAAGPVAGRNTS